MGGDESRFLAVDGSLCHNCRMVIFEFRRYITQGYGGTEKHGWISSFRLKTLRVSVALCENWSCRSFGAQKFNPTKNIAFYRAF